MKFQELIEDICYRNELSVALQDEANFVTYKELWQKIVYVRSIISNISKKKIGLWMQNEIDFIIYYIAILTTDNICAPIPFFCKSFELNNIIMNMDIDLIITSHKNYPENIYTQILNLNEMKSFEGLKIGSNKDKWEPNAKLFLMTSGSTGNPKIVMLSEVNIVSSALAHAKAVGINNNDKFLITMPIHFSSVLTTQILAYLFFGASIVVRKIPLLPRLIMNVLNSQKITALSGVPTLFRQLINENTTISSELSHICVSGASLDNKLSCEIVNKFNPKKLIQTYGMTEAAPRISLGIVNRHDSDIHSCGKLVEGVKIEIRNGIGQKLGPKEIGEIYVTGPNIMLGYYKNEEETNAVLQDNWLKTGDLGWLDNDNNLFVVGRIKNIIISGGQNINPEEIESHLKQHPYIHDCVVLPMKDTLLDEVPIALVVFKEFLEPQLLKQYCTERLSNYKIPRKFIEYNEFPSTRTGKVDRRRLLKDFSNYI